MVSLMGFSQSLVGRHLACLTSTDDDTAPKTMAVQQRPANEDRAVEADGVRKARFEAIRPRLVVDVSRVSNDVPAGLEAH
jgi:hypothetical protein